MNRRVYVQRTRALLCAVAIGATALISTPGNAAKTSATSTTQNLYSLIQKLTDSRMQSPKVVEKIIGAKISFIRNGIPGYYEARDVELKDVTIEVLRYWEPVKEGGAAGPLTEIMLGGSCIKKEDIFRRYNPSDSIVVSAPADWGHMTGKAEPWGDLFFGFLDKAPDCLRAVRIDMRVPHDKLPTASFKNSN